MGKDKEGEKKGSGDENFVFLAREDSSGNINNKGY